MENYRERIYKDYAKLLKSKQGQEGQISLESFKGRAPYLKKIIRDHFPQNKEANILELGCGHGAFIHFMRSMGYENIFGVDISSDQVIAAREMGIKGIMKGDLMGFLTTQSANSQDIVISFDVIEHFKKNELIPFIDEVHRVLRKSGMWIIHAPNGESPFFGRIRYGDFTHEQAFTRNSISQILLLSGFSDVQCFEDKPVVHGIKSAVRRLLWIGFRLIFLLFNASETGVWDRRSIFTQNFLTIAIKSPLGTNSKEYIHI